MWRLGLIAAAIVLLLDRLSKWWLIHVFEMPLKPEVTVTPFFKLVMWWNTGISFGVFSTGSDVVRWLLAALAIVVCIILVCWLTKTNRWLTALGIGLVLGGAIGNIYDRVLYGAVADFFYFHVGDWYWPAFNVADMGITIGVATLLFEAVTKPRPPQT